MAKKKRKRKPKVGVRQELWLALDQNYSFGRRAALLHDLASPGTERTQVYIWRMSKSKTRPYLKPGTILHGTWMVDRNPKRHSWRSPEFIVTRPTNLQLGILRDIPGYQHPTCGFEPYWSTGSAQGTLPKSIALPFTPHWYPLTFPRAGTLPTYEQAVPVLHDVAGDTLEVVRDMIGWRARLVVATQDEADRAYNHLLQIVQTQGLTGRACRYQVPEWGHWVVSYRTPDEADAKRVKKDMEFLDE